MRSTCTDTDTQEFVLEFCLNLDSWDLWIENRTFEEFLIENIIYLPFKV